jgi:YVTN family beta-propeller protein
VTPPGFGAPVLSVPSVLDVVSGVPEVAVAVPSAPAVAVLAAAAAVQPATPPVMQALNTAITNLFDSTATWLSDLPASPARDLISGALLLVRRTLFNQLPTAIPRKIIETSSGQYVGTVGAVDPEGGALIYSLAEAPQYGTVQITADGVYTYTPGVDFAGIDKFTVAVTDPGFNLLQPFSSRQSLVPVGVPNACGRNPGAAASAKSTGPASSTGGGCSGNGTFLPGVVATIRVGDRPSGVAISSDGTRAYVANYGSSNVSVIKTATNTVTSTIGVETPGRLAVSPDGSRVYVTADNLRQLSVIDTATNLVTATINLGGSPGDIAVSPDGTRGYVITRSTQNSDDTWVAVINTDPDSAGYNSVINRIKVGGNPVGLAVSAGGSEIYVTQSRTRTVSTIEAATNTITATVGVGNFPVGIAAGSRQIYVVNSYEFTPYKAPTLSVVSTVTDSVVATINIAKDAGRENRGKGSTWVAIAPGDGGKIWVTNPLDNLVAVIDSGEYINGMRPTNTVTATIGVGKTPAGVAITPDGRFAYVTNSGDGTVSVISTGTQKY